MGNILVGWLTTYFFTVSPRSESKYPSLVSKFCMHFWDSSFAIQSLIMAVCGHALLIFGCSAQVAEEPPVTHSISHNEAAIDEYLRELVASEDRKLTGFTEAARWGRIEIVEQFLEEGVGVDATDEYGRTALMLASEGGQLEVMRFLIDQGADVNFQNQRSGMTPLLALLNSLHSEGIYFSGTEILIDAGAKTNIHAEKEQSFEQLVMLRIREGRLRKEFLNEFVN